MYILSIFSILQIWANYNKNLCEKGDIYNFNEIGEAAAGGVDYPVSPHPASEAYPAGESMPGGEGNRRQIK